MIIGAQKAGTTSLKNYLGEHPSILTHPHTECSFFSSDKEYEDGYEKAYNRYFEDKKLDANTKVVAKNVTISFREFALERLAKHNSQCQIVFILRNPTKRAYSAYQMAVRSGWMDKSFDYAKEAIQKKQNDEYDTFYRFMIELGIYSMQIETLLKYFPKEQVTFLLYENLKKEPIETCQLIFKNLNIADTFQPRTDKIHNIGGEQKSQYVGKLFKYFSSPDNYLKKMVKRFVKEKYFVAMTQKMKGLNATKGEYKAPPKETMEMLNNFFQPYNEDCARLINKDLTYWSN